MHRHNFELQSRLYNQQQRTPIQTSGVTRDRRVVANSHSLRTGHRVMIGHGIWNGNSNCRTGVIQEVHRDQYKVELDNGAITFAPLGEVMQISGGAVTMR